MSARQKRPLARQRDRYDPAAVPKPQARQTFQPDEYLQEFQPQGIVEIDLVEDLVSTAGAAISSGSSGPCFTSG